MHTQHRYKERAASFTGRKVCLIFATFHGKIALPDKKEFIEKCLKRLDMDFPVQDYVVRAPGDPRRNEQGTAFVDGRDSVGPFIYVEDKVVLRLIGTTGSAAGRPESGGGESGRGESGTHDSSGLDSSHTPHTQLSSYSQSLNAHRPNLSALFPREDTTTLTPDYRV